MESTLIDVEKIKGLISLLDALSSELTDKQLWDLSKTAEQAKNIAQGWVFDE